MKRIMIGAMAVCGVLLGLAGGGGATVYYVAGDTGSDGNTGVGAWGNALATVTNALTRSTSGDEIWVKAGVYKPTTDTDRTKSIALKAGVGVYGGFNGTESTRDQRDWTNNLTVLSGDIGTSGVATDNVYHVVVGATAARMDGFTIQGGYANGALGNGYGGGMYNPGVHPITANCIFNSNYLAAVNTGGSAVYWDQGGNNVATVGWYNCTFESNEGYMPANWIYGGTMALNFYTNIVGGLSNCIFRNNICTGQYGRATVYLADSGRQWPVGAGLTLDSCRFISNLNCQVVGGGGGQGALEIQGFAAPVILTNCVFLGNNVRGSYSAGLYIFMPASGQGVRAYGCRFDSNYGYDGGAVYVALGGTNSIWQDCVFLNNSNRHAGGVFYGFDGTMIRCGFTNNVSWNWGGAIYLSSSGNRTNRIFDSCTFVSNRTSATASTDGGALYASYYALAPLIVSNTLFRENVSTTANGNGGALYLNLAATGQGTRVTGCLFDGNRGYDGGAVYCAAGASNSWWENCTFINNTGTHAGGVFAQLDGTVYNCGFTNNRARYWGGSLYLTAAGGTTNKLFTGCAFTGNSIWEPGYQGGAIYATYGFTCLNSTFTSNSATSGGGGAIYRSAASSISNCTFTGNSAPGADGAIYSGIGDAGVVDCRFIQNTSSDRGGAWFDNNTTGTIAYCTFISNASYRADVHSGGAIYIQVGGQPRIKNSVFLYNVATNASNSGGGGAIYSYQFAAGTVTPVVVNSIFRGNYANNAGGIYNEYGFMLVSNCTFYANTSSVAGYGGAIYQLSAGYTTTVHNTILWTNMPLQVSGTGIVTCRYCCVQGGYPGLGNLNVDPLFVDTTHLHLQSQQGNLRRRLFLRRFVERFARQQSPHRPGRSGQRRRA
jgi:predicted outer membrane repeat protein